jgi:LAS superfamily LD-carboxypeptidase LdcB
MVAAGAFRRHIENRIRAGNTTAALLETCSTANEHGQPAAVHDRRSSGAIVLVSAALVGVLVERSAATSNKADTAMSVTATSAPTPVTRTTTAQSSSFTPGPNDRLPRDQQGALGVADGVVPDGVTVFDEEYPAVAKLDPALLRALRQAATDAARDRVTFSVDSGWRSPKYQEQLLREAISKYGSAEEAARWVATPDTSPHVLGDAVDIGPSAATAWLSAHGATYWLCEIYGNDPWHYELRVDAVGNGCPRMYADPTDDPRMQR